MMMSFPMEAEEIVIREEEWRTRATVEQGVESKGLEARHHELNSI